MHPRAAHSLCRSSGDFRTQTKTVIYMSSRFYFLPTFPSRIYSRKKALLHCLQWMRVANVHLRDTCKQTTFTNLDLGVLTQVLALNAIYLSNVFLLSVCQSEFLSRLFPVTAFPQMSGQEKDELLNSSQSPPDNNNDNSTFSSQTLHSVVRCCLEHVYSLYCHFEVSNIRIEFQHMLMLSSQFKGVKYLIASLSNPIQQLAESGMAALPGALNQSKENGASGDLPSNN